jgi:aspartyl-tRNA(Asn)/glutamyl-tRNA(Gln) amidotransferase subunit A
MVGLPGITVPVGFIEGLPVGMQILGPHFKEELLYQVAYAYEEKNPWWQTSPKLE